MNNEPKRERRDEGDEDEKKAKPASGSVDTTARNIAAKFLRVPASRSLLEKGVTIAKRVTGAIKDSARTAIEIARNFFSQPTPDTTDTKSFLSFNPQEYLKLYYPEINADIAGLISTAVAAVQKEGVVDIATLELALEADNNGREEIAVEALENYCIYDFMLSRAIPRILRDIPQDHLTILDIGGGPTIYQHIPLLGIADSIIHSEFLESNRKEMEAWRAHTSSFQWKSYIQYYQTHLRNMSDSFSMATAEVQSRLQTLANTNEESVEDELRQRIQRIIPVNAFESNLGISEDLNPDLVHIPREGSIELMTSNFCIESATADRALWKMGIQNVCRKVPFGKFLMMTAIRNAERYTVGTKQMPAVPVDGHDVREELEKNGFEVLELQELVGSDKETVGYDGMVFVLAKKVH